MYNASVFGAELRRRRPVLQMDRLLPAAPQDEMTRLLDTKLHGGPFAQYIGLGQQVYWIVCMMSHLQPFRLV